MSSSLSVMHLAPAFPTHNCAAAGTLEEAWAATQAAWYPDTAYVVCGRPGHYRVSVLVVVPVCIVTTRKAL